MKSVIIIICLLISVVRATPIREPARVYHNIVPEATSQAHLEGLEMIVISHIQTRDMKLSSVLVKLAAGNIESTEAYAPKFKITQKESEVGDRLVSMDLKRMSLASVLDVICDIADTEWWADGAVIYIQTKKEK